MKTTLDQDNILYTLLATSSLESEISGMIIKGGEITDFSKENVVIKSIVVDGGQDIQKGFANVNIHVPDIEISIAGKPTKQPNNARLKELTDLATEVLQEYFNTDYNLYIDSISVFKDLDGIDNHFINFKIRFNFL